MDTNKSIYCHICIKRYKHATHVKALIYFCFGKNIDGETINPATINHHHAQDLPAKTNSIPFFSPNFNKEIIEEIALKNVFTLI